VGRPVGLGFGHGVRDPDAEGEDGGGRRGRDAGAEANRVADPDGRHRGQVSLEPRREVVDPTAVGADHGREEGVGRHAVDVAGGDQVLPLRVAQEAGHRVASRDLGARPGVLGRPGGGVRGGAVLPFRPGALAGRPQDGLQRGGGDEDLGVGRGVQMNGRDGGAPPEPPHLEVVGERAKVGRAAPGHLLGPWGGGGGCPPRRRRRRRPRGRPTSRRARGAPGAVARGRRRSGPCGRAVGSLGRWSHRGRS